MRQVRIATIYAPARANPRTQQPMISELCFRTAKLYGGATLKMTAYVNIPEHGDCRAICIEPYYE
jgi:hypothetical protein